MREVKNSMGELIGIINKATIKTLRTRHTPFVAAIPNKFHGIKIDYFKDLNSAVKWVRNEYL